MQQNGKPQFTGIYTAPVTSDSNSSCFLGDLYGFTGIYTAPGTLHRGYKKSVAQKGSFNGTLNIFSFCDSFFIFKLSIFSDLDEIEAGSLDETGRIFFKHGNLFFSLPSQNDEQR